jgi:hypothetical protein
MMRRLHDHFPALCRLALGGNAIVSWYSAIHDTNSQLFQIARTADGGALMWIMAIIGAVLVIDVILNDWTPESIRVGSHRFRLYWHRAFRYRHFLFAGLAFCYAAQPYVAEMRGGGVSLLIFFYWNSFLNLVVALLDAKQRSRATGWARACS